MTTTKPAWEIAWERAQPAIAKVTTENQDYIGTILRDGFRQGYDARSREVEAMVREARAEGWSVGYERAMNDRDASDWADASETHSPYAPEETKPND